MSVRKAVWRETVGFGAAEFTGIVASLGTVAILDQLIPKEIMHHASQVVAKTCIEPFFDTIEKGLSKCKSEECKVDKNKSHEERAEIYAKTLIIFASSLVASLGLKLLTRRQMNNILLGKTSVQHKPAEEGMNFLRKRLHDINPANWSPEERMILFADEGVHLGLGGLMLFSDKGAGLSDDMINSTQRILGKCGIPEDKAKQIADMAVIWELPNIAGALAGIGAIFGKHAYNLPHLDRLKSNSLHDIITGKSMSEHAAASH